MALIHNYKIKQNFNIYIGFPIMPIIVTIDNRSNWQFLCTYLGLVFEVVDLNIDMEKILDDKY